MTQCRHCLAKHLLPFLDLGAAPYSNAYLTKDQLVGSENFYPLRLNVCTHCWLVQTLGQIKAEELFTSDYAYFSSTSTSWLEHSRDYVEMIVPRLGLNASSFVVEIASNDGYLLKNFVEKNIPCLGIEPTNSTAEQAIALGIPTRKEFFNCALADQLVAEDKQADLIIGNNVLAHVPNINEFVQSLAIGLKRQGTITLEFPHVLSLMQSVQFDTVYHEHYSYLSVHTVQRILAQSSLQIIDIQRLNTHGGSLRLFVTHHDDPREVMSTVQEVLELEKCYGLQSQQTYRDFQDKCDKIKNALLLFLIQKRKEGKKCVGYGAAAKGNTLLNYAGIKQDLLPFVCDAAPSKQGKFLPGSRIPIVPPDEIEKCRPDFVVILPWNLSSEVIKQLNYIREWDGKFVTFIPELKIQ